MTEIQSDNPLHKLYSVITEIVDTVADVNYERANLSEKEARQWWFPNYPEKVDENYPRGSIEFGTASLEEFGSAQYVQEVKDNNGNVVKEQYGEYIVIPVTLHVHIKKDQRHEVILYDGTKHSIKNQKLGDFMAFLVNQSLRKNKRMLIDKGFDLQGKPTITPTYDDNHFLFSADVSFNVVALSVWDENYDLGSIINTINTAIQAIQA
jgi:hypothetical protein